jgi:hypothetical protein
MRARFLCVLSVAAALSLVGSARSATTEKGPDYDIQGRYYDTCACQVSCSCGANVTLPSEGHCDGIVLLHIEKGKVGPVGVEGLNLAIVLRSPEGKKVEDALENGDMDHLTVYIDDHATPEQRKVMPSLLAGLLGTRESRGFKPPQFAPMTLSQEGDTARFQIAGGGKLSFEIENIDVEKTKPGVPHPAGKRIALTNVAPFPWISNVTQGYSKLFTYSDYGVSWEYKNRNAFFGTFATKGTSPAPPPPPS